MTFEWRFGIEEEYFLTDRRTGAACAAPSADFWADLKTSAPTASKELLQSQVEAKTSPCRTAAQCLAELQEARGAIDDTAKRHDLGIMAAGTHPDFDWRDSQKSIGARYTTLSRSMRMLAPRNVFCGLHVHVEIPAEMSRIAVMNRCSPYLPLFLALSVSSPLWRGEWTGMHGYRLTGYDELPRTGLPPVFANDADYARYVAALTEAGAIPDASYLWWAIRPSLRFPTLELRVCDSVTDVRAAVAIACLFRAFVLRAATDPAFAVTASPSLRAIAEENRWQVQCDGLSAAIVDVETLKPISVRDAIDKLVADLAPQAAQFGCGAELDHVRALLAQPTSAESQMRIFDEASPGGGVAAVNEWLLQATLA